MKLTIIPCIIIYHFLKWVGDLSAKDYPIFRPDDTLNESPLKFSPVKQRMELSFTTKPKSKKSRMSTFPPLGKSGSPVKAKKRVAHSNHLRIAQTFVSTSLDSI